MKRQIALVGILMCVAASAVAGGMQPLTVSTLPDLQQQYAGQRHAIIFWSLRCLPCREELVELGERSDISNYRISLVNTDGAVDISEANKFLEKHHLAALNNWRIADAMPARVRQAFDSNWYGALPRSYVITATGKRIGHSGKSDVSRLLNWLTARENVARSGQSTP